MQKKNGEVRFVVCYTEQALILKIKQGFEQRKFKEATAETSELLDFS